MNSATPHIDSAYSAITEHMRRTGQEPSALVCSTRTGIALRSEIYTYANRNGGTTISRICYMEHQPHVNQTIRTGSIDLFGLPIVTSRDVPDDRKEWSQPHDRFFRYEESDRDWCQFFGLGIHTSRPRFNTMHMEDGRQSPGFDQWSMEHK